MRNSLSLSIALLALSSVEPALAADLAARPYTKAPTPIYNWTGFYIGTINGHGGI